MFVPCELQLCLGLKTHILYLRLVLGILLVNILNFIFSIIHDLLDDLSVVFLHPLDFPSELLSLSDLPLHECPVLLHDSGNILVVLIDDVVDSLLELPRVFLLLGLQLLELGCILEHLLRILVSLLFQLDLELLSKLLNLFFEGVLHFSLVLIQRIVSVLCLYLRV